MKTTNKFLILSLAVGLLAGCHFFDNDSPSASSSEMIFSNVSDTERAIAAVYELFGYDRQSLQTQTFPTRKEMTRGDTSTR